MGQLNPRQQQAIVTIGKVVLSQTKPEEIILLDDLVSERTAKRGEEILGFGHGLEVFSLLSPVLIGFLKDAAEHLIEVLGEDAGEALAKKLTEKGSQKIDSANLRALHDAFALRLERAGFSADDVAVTSDCLTTVLLEHTDWLRSLVS